MSEGSGSCSCPSGGSDVEQKTDCDRLKNDKEKREKRMK